jgi:hypothetical protein
MAFADSLLSHTDATITIVDKRHAPGGHWIEAYPFVRLHQPSAFYGVDSVPFGSRERDTLGTNAGFYELASGDEIRAYYRRVMDHVFLPSGRVQYLPSTEFLDDGTVRSLIAGETRKIAVNKRIVDTTYLEGRFPATSPPPFEVEEGARVTSPAGLANLRETAENFTVIGAGKTALDVCVWLLEQGVSPDAIRWIKPREAWWINRRFQQPFDLVPDSFQGVATQLEAISRSSSIDELFSHLEEAGFFLRVDRETEATMFRGAIVSEGELELLRQIKNVVRLGRVQRIHKDRIVLDGGEIPTDENTLHIHCASRGLAWKTVRPMFEPGRITVQPFTWAFSCFQFALLGVVEAMLQDDDQKNQLCQPMPFWATNRDYLAVFSISLIHDQMRKQYPEIDKWAKQSRLNPLSGLGDHRDSPIVVEAKATMQRVGLEAFQRMQTLLAETPEAPRVEAATG